VLVVSVSVIAKRPHGEDRFDGMPEQPQAVPGFAYGVTAMLKTVNSCVASVGFSLFVWGLTTGMAASQGQTITLRVPVEVSKIYKNVYGMEVRCSILDASDHVIKNSGYLEDVKGLINGALSHVFEIVIELSDEEALAAKKYKCDLLIGWGYGLEPAISTSTGGPDPGEQFPQRQARPAAAASEVRAAGWRRVLSSSGFRA
jgi:hypothetical protein